MKTVLINLFGGPGSGKSTTAALLFAKLKMLDVNAELVQEYAKELVWNGVTDLEQWDVYIEQKKRIYSLINKVDIIISDSPLELSYYYGRNNHTFVE